MSRTALFVIDIQRALADSHQTQIPHAKRIIDAGTTILEVEREIIDHSGIRGELPHLEIIVVQHEETPEKGNLQRGSTEWELVFPPRYQGHDLVVRDEYLISKDVREYSSPQLLHIGELKLKGDTFASNPTLAAELKARDVGTIVAFGIQSECCVFSTCRGALAAGFKVVLLRDAHSTYDTDEKTALEIEREVEEMLKSEGVMVVDWKKWIL